MSVKSKARRAALYQQQPAKHAAVCPNCHHMFYSDETPRRCISLSSRLRYVKYRWSCCRVIQTIDRETGEATWGNS